MAANQLGSRMQARSWTQLHEKIYGKCASFWVLQPVTSVFREQAEKAWIDWQNADPVPAMLGTLD
jgi:hypothetical protein